VHRIADGKAWVELSDGVRLPAPPSQAPDGLPVVYGVRPEDLSLVPADQGLTGQVAVVEPTGADIHVLVRAAGVDVIVVFRERHAFRPGQAITLKPDVAKTHLFDAARGTRM
jgi:multiple sugar transport system ATP-binding protein